MSVAAIVGSAFAEGAPAALGLVEETIETEFGLATVHRCSAIERPAYVLFRHGLPHALLPQHINYRANAAALKRVGCDTLLVTSSVGVLNPDLPMNTPFLVDDLVYLDNRLPDGTACTMFPVPVEGHAHLVLDDGLLSSSLARQLETLAEGRGHTLAQRVTFAYVQGPRTKTSAENRLLKTLGVDVNSMTLAPEVVLANELEMACAALVVGHKPSRANARGLGPEEIAASLREAKAASTALIVAFLEQAKPVQFANTLFRF